MKTIFVDRELSPEYIKRGLEAVIMSEKEIPNRYPLAIDAPLEAPSGSGPMRCKEHNIRYAIEGCCPKCGNNALPSCYPQPGDLMRRCIDWIDGQFKRESICGLAQFDNGRVCISIDREPANDVDCVLEIVIGKIKTWTKIQTYAPDNAKSLMIGFVERAFEAKTSQARSEAKVRADGKLIVNAAGTFRPEFAPDAPQSVKLLPYPLSKMGCNGCKSTDSVKFYISEFEKGGGGQFCDTCFATRMGGKRPSHTVAYEGPLPKCHACGSVREVRTFSDNFDYWFRCKECCEKSVNWVQLLYEDRIANRNRDVPPLLSIKAMIDGKEVETVIPKPKEPDNTYSFTTGVHPDKATEMIEKCAGMVKAGIRMRDDAYKYVAMYRRMERFYKSGRTERVCLCSQQSIECASDLHDKLCPMYKEIPF